MIVIVFIPQAPVGAKYNIHSEPIIPKGDQSLVKMS